MWAGVLHPQVDCLFVNSDCLFAWLVRFVIAEVALYRGLLQKIALPAFAIGEINEHLRFKLRGTLRILSSCIEIVQLCFHVFVSVWISRILIVPKGRENILLMAFIFLATGFDHVLLDAHLGAHLEGLLLCLCVGRGRDLCLIFSRTTLSCWRLSAGENDDNEDDIAC